MAKRFEIKNNFLVVTDTVSGSIEINEPKKDVKFKPNAAGDGVAIKHIDDSELIQNYAFADVVDSGDLAFADFGTFLTFLYTNLGA